MKSLDLVMIARDEARCIARCLNSVRSWVNQMWVLDTGSVDDTAAIARRCGAQVAHFVWCDDFAAARNAALALSQADWVLVLDADEWIDGAAPALTALKTTAQDFIGQISVVSQFDAGDSIQEAPSWISRVLPRGVRYSGPVHEQPESDLPRRRLALSVMHDGYRATQMQTKQGRNRALLLQALAQDPNDAYLRYQLGKDFELQGDYTQAEAQYALAAAPAAAGWRHDLILRRLFSLKKLQRHEQALALAADEMPAWPASPDFYFTVGDVLLDWAAQEPARGGELLPMIENAWVKAIDIGEQPQLQDTVRGRGSFLAAHNLAVLHESLGHSEQAGHWREREAKMRA